MNDDDELATIYNYVNIHIYKIWMKQTFKNENEQILFML